MTKVGVQIIIQARMGSSRLPGKSFMPFVGEISFLQWVIERCKTSRQADKVVIATTENAKDDVIEELCKENGYDYIRGSEGDVLERYYVAAQKFGSGAVVRVMADNPLIDVLELDRIVEVLLSENLDYASNHPAGLPVGTGSEVFTMAAFERVYAEATDPYDHEHVTPYFYHHPELFKQRNVEPEVLHPFASQVRLTLDTAEDLQMLKALAVGMGFSRPAEQPATNEILSYLETHPELVQINQSVVQKTFPKA
ncbi:MAG: glycosyltransferase family protein [Candidatus Paceibacterota bacterium]|jgi:spore coat polysaccharide biosynthesis protein SpsF